MSSELLALPMPPAALRPHTGTIEDALAAVRELSFVLEGLAGAAVADESLVDVGMLGALVSTVQSQAGDLSQQLRDLPSRCANQGAQEVAGGYARAAATAYGVVLQRITTANEQLRQRGEGGDVEVVSLVAPMLADHPWRAR